MTASRGPTHRVGKPLEATEAAERATQAAVLGDTGDLRGFRALQPFWPFVLVTLAACTAWALLLGRGPLERLLGWVARRVAP